MSIKRFSICGSVLAVASVGAVACGAAPEAANDANASSEPSASIAQELIYAPNGIPYCEANNGRGWGDIFPCSGYRCAKTDVTYREYCVVKDWDSSCEPWSPCCSPAGWTFGCWYDGNRGLEWQTTTQQQPMIWQDALAYCDSLNVGGRDDWRLPSIDELRTLIQGCSSSEGGGACNVSDSCTAPWCNNGACGGCSYRRGPAPSGMYIQVDLDGPVHDVWSSTAADLNTAWRVNFNLGDVVAYDKGAAHNTARCVRSVW